MILWMLVPLLIVLVTAYAFFASEPPSRVSPLFPLRLSLLVLVSYLLGSAIPMGLDAIFARDSLSANDLIVFCQFISPFGILLGLVCGTCSYYAIHLRQAFSLLVSEFVVIAYAVIAMFEFMRGSASV